MIMNFVFDFGWRIIAISGVPVGVIILLMTSNFVRLNLAVKMNWHAVLWQKKTLDWDM